MRDIDKIILKLFQDRWTKNLSEAPIEDMRKQLHKNLLDQTRGYWSGHTAYHIMIDGGFLTDAKSNTYKKLTSLGAEFMDDYQLTLQKEGRK